MDADPRSAATPPALSDVAFGPDLARRLWDHLIALPPTVSGTLHGFFNWHRDYCGHALLRIPTGVALAVVDDYWMRPAIVEWSDVDAFVAFWSRQSDASCSGWDPAEPLFGCDDPRFLGNQRITRDWLEKALQGRR